MTAPALPALRWLPNAISLARIASIPAIVVLLVETLHREALWLTVAAGLSDWLDGVLARRLRWTSRLGALLDPLADKLLVNALLVGLWAAGALPGWLAAVTLVRDATLAAGAAAWRLRHGPLRIAPSRLGKATTLAQLALVVAALMHLAYGLVPAAGLAAGAWIVAAMTVAAGADYVVRWQYKARAASKED